MNIGKQLRKLRHEKNLTLDQAAGLTGVSKPMIGQIERNASSPTISTLWKIASGLKVPLSVLLHETENAFQVAHAAGKPDLEEESGHMKAWTLFPFDPKTGFEAYMIELDPGCIHHSQPHQPGVEELVLPVAGILNMEAGEEAACLSSGNVLRFAADQEHSYRNEQQEGCRFYNLIFYGG